MRLALLVSPESRRASSAAGFPDAHVNAAIDAASANNSALRDLDRSEALAAIVEIMNGAELVWAVYPINDGKGVEFAILKGEDILPGLLAGGGGRRVVVDAIPCDEAAALELVEAVGEVQALRHARPGQALMTKDFETAKRELIGRANHALMLKREQLHVDTLAHIVAVKREWQRSPEARGVDIAHLCEAEREIARELAAESAELVEETLEDLRAFYQWKMRKEPESS